MSTPTLAFPQSLTEKYRTRSINEFGGLDKPKRILSKFAANPYPSAWLFVGPSGVGKTAMALALAESLKAELHHIPSQQCLVANVEEVIRQCWYVPVSGGFHLILVDGNLRVSKVFSFGPKGEGSISTGGEGRGAQTGPFNGATSGRGNTATGRLYNLSISMGVRNILNHNNPGPIIGNITSPLFGRANQPYGANSLGGDGILRIREQSDTRTASAP